MTIIRSLISNAAASAAGRISNAACSGYELRSYHDVDRDRDVVVVRDRLGDLLAEALTTDDPDEPVVCTFGHPLPANVMTCLIAEAREQRRKRVQQEIQLWTPDGNAD